MDPGLYATTSGLRTPLSVLMAGSTSTVNPFLVRPVDSSFKTASCRLVLAWADLGHCWMTCEIERSASERLGPSCTNTGNEGPSRHDTRTTVHPSIDRMGPGLSRQNHSHRRIDTRRSPSTALGLFDPSHVGYSRTESLCHVARSTSFSTLARRIS